MKAIRCRRCKTLVMDGVNGSIHEPPPWLSRRARRTAYCYACENADFEAADLQAVMRSLNMAARNGRFDLL